MSMTQLSSNRLMDMTGFEVIYSNVEHMLCGSLLLVCLLIMCHSSTMGRQKDIAGIQKNEWLAVLLQNGHKISRFHALQRKIEN